MLGELVHVAVGNVSCTPVVSLSWCSDDALSAPVDVYSTMCTLPNGGPV